MSNTHFADTVAVISGATRGIGRALFSHLESLGATVYGCGRTLTKMENMYRADITSTEEVRAWRDYVADRHGRVNLLINNAGILGSRAPFVSIEEDVWRQVLDVNVHGTINVTRHFLTLLRSSEASPSTIINIGSVLGVFGRAGWSTYTVSKFALQGLTEVLAQELAVEGVRVVCLHPPRITTVLRRSAYPEEAENAAGVFAVLEAVEKIQASPCWPISGLTLSASDVQFWSR